MYTYVSSDPENGLVLSADLEKNVITLRYERTVTTGGGGSSRDYYDVTVNYYDQDGNTIRSSYTTGDIREGRSWDVTDRQLDTITYNGVTYTFDRAEGDPLSGTNIREDKVIDLYYTAESENIPDPEVPEGELPTDPTDPGTTDPTQPGDSTDLEDPDVPTAEVPETGDTSLIWAAVALLSGIGIGKRNGVGVACVCRSDDEVRSKFKPGNVLVVPATNNNMLDSIRDASAIIAEEAGVNSHAAIVGLTLGKPVVVGAAGATRKLHDGVRVSVDGERGVVHSMPQ